MTKFGTSDLPFTLMLKTLESIEFIIRLGKGRVRIGRDSIGDDSKDGGHDDKHPS